MSGTAYPASLVGEQHFQAAIEGCRVGDDVTITAIGTGSGTGLDVRVAASTDDVEESATGGMTMGSSDLELVFDGSNQTVGLRFTGLAIPAGATVSHAHVQFRVDEAQSEATSLVVQVTVASPQP